jgi:hypothetical protein
MGRLAPRDQTVRVGGQLRRLYLKQATADPDVAPVSLTAATDTLRESFNEIVSLARETERAVARAPARKPLDADAPPAWSLALDEICTCGVEMAPRLPFNGPRDFTGPRRAPVVPAKAASPLSQILQPIRLDPITVADDDRFLEITAQQPNVSQPIREGLADLY